MNRPPFVRFFAFLCGALLVAPPLVEARAAHRVPPPVAATALAASSSVPTGPQPIASTGNTAAPNGSGLTRSDLIGIVQPAVVRIVSHFSGTTTVPIFQLNLKTLEWEVDTGTSTPVPYDEYALGSGFIVNANGYIVTNSHVVSSAELASTLASRLAERIVFYEDYHYGARQTAKLDALSDADFYALIDKGAKFIEQHVTIPAPTVVVLRPGAPLPATSTPVSVIQQQQSAQGTYGLINQLTQAGVSAQIVSVNNNYLDDEKDVALIKVEETGLPVIHLASADATHEGDQIFVVSFPGSADLNSYSVQPSFTSGTVNALKDSTQHTFSYLQTDADISSGSSGSPMLNSNGEAVGVTTLSVTSDNGGTAFAFGIPVSLVDQTLAANGVTNTATNDYASYMRKGLALEVARHCGAAKKEFLLAEKSNNAFGGVTTFVDPHIQACNALIASGKSVDTWFDYVSSWFSMQTVQFWVLFVLAAVLILGLGAGVVILTRHMRKDEALLRELEKREEQEEVLLHTLEERKRASESHAPEPSVPESASAQEPVITTEEAR